LLNKILCSAEMDFGCNLGRDLLFSTIRVRVGEV